MRSSRSSNGSATQPAVAQEVAAGRLGRRGEKTGAVLNQPLIGGMSPVPFEQGEFGVVQTASFTISEGVREREDPFLARRQ